MICLLRFLLTAAWASSGSASACFGLTFVSFSDFSVSGQSACMCGRGREKKKSVSGVVLASFACRGRLLDSWSPGRSVSHP